MKKFTILDTGVYRADPFVILNELQEAVAQSVEKNGGHYAHGLREITDHIAALEARLKEAEEVIKQAHERIGYLSDGFAPDVDPETLVTKWQEDMNAWLKGGAT